MTIKVLIRIALKLKQDISKHNSLIKNRHGILSLNSRLKFVGLLSFIVIYFVRIYNPVYKLITNSFLFKIAPLK